MELSLRKYLSFALKWLIPFAFLEILICILFFTSVIKSGLFAFIFVINIICLLLPGAYFLTMFFIFKKKCKCFTPIDGVIVNWEAGFYRYTGSVIINSDGKEYSTSSYFTNEECKGLVGKHVSYAIIDEMLFIYEINDLSQ